jgi:hypothetical protein
VSLAGWPYGPASGKQLWLIRKLREFEGESLELGEFTEGSASMEIDRLRKIDEWRRINARIAEAAADDAS